MYEKYTQSARRVIFFARYEANQFGSPKIEAEHLLLALIRVDKDLPNSILQNFSLDGVRNGIPAVGPVRDPDEGPYVESPLSPECMRILAYAQTEAEQCPYLNTKHLLMGILREEGCFAAEALGRGGVTIDLIRKNLPARVLA